MMRVLSLFTSKKITSFFIVLAVLVSVIPVQAQEIANIANLETATVLKVIDGDTLSVKYNEKKETIRLIGIDAPESKANEKAKRDSTKIITSQGKAKKDAIKIIVAQGKEATKFVRGLVKAGEIVRIEFDIQQRDRYGRLLGYVYLSNGKMLNEEIISNGYASPLTIPPNVKYQDRFLKAFRDARDNKRGLWKE